MRKSVSAGLFLFGSILLLTTCKKKNDPPPPSSDAFIYSFVFHATENPTLGQDVSGSISHDTIYLNIKTGVDITNLVPTVTFTGASINPTSKSPQNFTNPVLYTVTAQNGKTKTYRTQIRFLSNSKEITSFIFKKEQNSTLDSNITGTIAGDSILINVPPGVNLASLVPTITHTGISISPLNQQANDFTFPASYIVTAEDGTARNYKVFISANKSVYINSVDGYLYSLNTSNGNIQWKFFTGGQAVPTYYSGTVFISGANNVVYAINASDGSLKWNSTPPKGNYSLTMPAIYGGKVYFGGSGLLNYPNSIYAYYAGFVLALNMETGNQEWMDTLFTHYPYTNSMLTNVTVKDNIACVYDRLNGLFVYNATDGSELWASVGDMLGRANPLLLNNVIYYGIEGGMRAVRADNGQEVWKLLNSASYYSPTFYNNIIYAVDVNHNLYAIDLSGNIKWQISLDLNNSYSTPYVSNGTIYILNTAKLLNAYSAQDGSLKWRKSSFSGQLIVANNEIYIYDVNNQLNCLDAATGNIKWISPIQNTFSLPFCVVDGKGNAYHITDSGEQQ